MRFGGRRGRWLRGFQSVDAWIASGDLFLSVTGTLLTGPAEGRKDNTRKDHQAISTKAATRPRLFASVDIYSTDDATGFGYILRAFRLFCLGPTKGWFAVGEYAGAFRVAAGRPRKMQNFFDVFDRVAARSRMVWSNTNAKDHEWPSCGPHRNTRFGRRDAENEQCRVPSRDSRAADGISIAMRQKDKRSREACNAPRVLAAVSEPRDARSGMQTPESANMISYTACCRVLRPSCREPPSRQVTTPRGQGEEHRLAEILDSFRERSIAWNYIPRKSLLQPCLVLSSTPRVSPLIACVRCLTSMPIRCSISRLHPPRLIVVLGRREDTSQSRAVSALCRCSEPTASAFRSAAVGLDRHRR